MWIESVRFVGFGSIANERVEFSRDDLNLIVEPNEYGKSTMVESIWAILFDFPGDSLLESSERESMRPWDSSMPYSGILDLEAGGRSLRIIRDFQDRTVTVLDRGQDDLDVTGEFLDESGEEQVGLKLTGMSRDLFRNTCLVGQRHLDEHHAGGTGNIIEDLQAIADSSSTGSTAGTAVGIIKETMAHYPYGSGRSPITSVIAELNARKEEIIARLAEMDGEREMMASWLVQIEEADRQISGESANPMDIEYNNIKLELAELERRLEHLNDRMHSREELEARLAEHNQSSPLPDIYLNKINELWTRRESRKSDMEHLNGEIQPNQEEYERLEQALNEQWQGFEDFTQEEANTVSTLAVNLYNLQREILDLKRDLQETTGRRLAPLIESASHEKGAYKLAKLLSKEEIEEARSFSSLVVAFKEQLVDAEKKLEEVKFNVDDIAEKQLAYRNNCLVKSILTFVGAIVLVLIPPMLKSSAVDVPQIVVTIFMGAGLLLFPVFLFFVSRCLTYKSHMADEKENTMNEEHKIKKALQQSQGKIANLEIKLSNLAQKAGLDDKQNLLAMLEQASSEAVIIEEQESRENVVKTREQNEQKLLSDLSYYFNKAGRSTEVIDSQRAMDLSQDINAFYAEKMSLNQRFQQIHNARKQMDFLAQEIVQIDKELAPTLLEAGIDISAGTEEKLDEITTLLEFQNKRQEILDELSKLEYDLSNFANVDTAATDLMVQRDALVARLNELVDLKPELADLPEPDPTNPPAALLPWGEGEGASRAREKKEELLVKLRTACNNRDENYLDSVEELSSVEHELVCAKRAKLALELAVSVLNQSSATTYTAWSERLNEAASEIIEALDSDVESLSFDNDLHITVKLKSLAEPVASAEIKSRLSTGLREQVHWLARMALARYLSSEEPLPIILDEPFSEADDARFLGIMRFLIDSVLPNHQVILLSCHHQRHQWLLSQLDEERAARLSFRNRIKAVPAAD
ncbi:MAG: AAA family ATPase [Candidatus Melainabacteria bacterium]|nr:AAA family ATPase [Candidatus Melainabacteria bacterium]